jgi:hypothetical protein
VSVGCLLSRHAVNDESGGLYFVDHAHRYELGDDAGDVSFRLGGSP